MAVIAGQERLLFARQGALPYVVAAPADRAESSRPVLCFLHGHDEGAPEPALESLTRHGPLSARAAAAAQRSIVVAPQMPMRGDVWYRYSNDVVRIVQAVQNEYGGDPDRVCLTGFSFGGNGVFDLAMLGPGIWAALWPVDPTRVPARKVEGPVWLSIGAAARRLSRQFIRALDLAPVSDGTIADRVYLDEGADHVESAALAYADERIYRWLASQRLGR